MQRNAPQKQHPKPLQIVEDLYGREAKRKLHTMLGWRCDISFSSRVTIDRIRPDAKLRINAMLTPMHQRLSKEAARRAALGDQLEIDQIMVLEPAWLDHRP